MIVLAGFSRNGESKSKLKDECSGRLHVIDLDISNQESISEAIKVITEHSQSEKSFIYSSDVHGLSID